MCCYQYVRPTCQSGVSGTACGILVVSGTIWEFSPLHLAQFLFWLPWNSLYFILASREAGDAVAYQEMYSSGSEIHSIGKDFIYFFSQESPQIVYEE